LATRTVDEIVSQNIYESITQDLVTVLSWH